MDWLLLRSRTEPPAREEAILPGLARLAGALRRDRPCRVFKSVAGSSSWSATCGVAGAELPSCVGASSDSSSVSFPLALPFVLDFRDDVALDELDCDPDKGRKSSIGSSSGRGVAGAATML